MMTVPGTIPRIYLQLVPEIVIIVLYTLFIGCKPEVGAWRRR